MGAIIFKGNFRVSGQFSREQFSLEAIVRGERCVFWGGNFPKRQLPLGVIVSRQLSGGQLSKHRARYILRSSGTLLKDKKCTHK